MIGLFNHSNSPPSIRELPLNDSLTRSGEAEDGEDGEYDNDNDDDDDDDDDDGEY